jgi:hypothetical protein
VRKGAVSVLFLMLASCGYHAGGKADLMPKGIQTIAIPAFGNVSARYKLADVLPQQIGREFIAKTRYRIVNNTNDADAVLNGNITAAQSYPVLFDPASGRSTSLQVTVVLSVNLIERSTGRVLYSRPNYGFRQNYDVAVDPHQFFDESGPALDRLSRDLAHDLVTSIVENF